MRIGIDACTWSNRRGYGRFTRGLVASMVAEYPWHEFVLVVDRFTAEEGGFPAGSRLEVVAVSAQPTMAAAANGARSPRDLWRMGLAVSRLDPDVFLFPTRYSYFPLLDRTPTVVVFHDATGELHPELVFPQWRSRLLWKIKTRLALWRADRLVTVSIDARKQIAAVFGYPESAIEVVSEGADSVFRALAADVSLHEVRRTYGLPSDLPLVLYVGGISPHKNLDGLLRAMKLLDREVRAPAHLVLVGDYQCDSFLSCYHELVALADSLGVSRSITFTGFVPDDQLVLLYNAASLLVLPSFSEGFGLPVIEAMACGLPVAVSERSSLPEVVGSAGLLFDPSSPEQMAATIGRLLTDDSFRRELGARGLARSAAYSWRAGARTMVQVLEEAARGGPVSRNPLPGQVHD